MNIWTAGMNKAVRKFNATRKSATAGGSRGFFAPPRPTLGSLHDFVSSIENRCISYFLRHLSGSSKHGLCGQHVLTMACRF